MKVHACMIKHIHTYVLQLLIMFFAQANTLEIKGHGHMHAVYLNVTANTMVVDDLGLVIGDLHKNACVQGDGITSTQGASGNTVLLSYVLHIFNEQEVGKYLQE